MNKKFLIHVGASAAMAALLVPAAGGLATTAKAPGPAIKFKKKEKVYTTSDKVTQKIKCLGTGSQKCKGTLTTKMVLPGSSKNRTLSKNKFSIKPGKWTTIKLKLTKWGEQERSLLISSPQWNGKCAVKAKAHQGKSKTQTSTGMVGYKLVS